MNELANIARDVAPGAKVSYGFRHGENGTGIHFYVDYANGWRLSVVKAYGTYDIECGLFDPDGNMPDDNPVLESAVEGWVTEERLTEIIAKVATLPSRPQRSIEG